MAIEEVLLHEISEADLRKASATSNDAQTGGGARDLRFRMLFADCLDRFFPEEVSTEKGVQFRIGEFEYLDPSGAIHIDKLKYAFQPTHSRSNEVRIAQINKAQVFRDLLELPPTDDMLFIALIRFSKGLPRIQYLTASHILDDDSNRQIADALREALNNRKPRQSVIFSLRLE